MTRRLRTASALLLLALFAPGCASTTFIRSVPAGAQVYVNGEPRGVTPYVHTDSSPSWTTLLVTLRAPGYQDLNVAISRGDKFAVGPFIGGLFIWPILFWMFEYRPDYVFQLAPQGAPPAVFVPGALLPPPPPPPVGAGPVALPPPPPPPIGAAALPVREEIPDAVWRALQGRPVNVTRNDGSVVSGTLSAFAATTVTLVLPTGQPLTLERASLASVRGQ